MGEISDTGLDALGIKRPTLLFDKFMNKDNESKIIRSDIYKKIFSVISKLELAESSGDNYDHASIATEIEILLPEYSRQREQQEAISFAKFCVKHCNATAGDNFAFAEKPFAQLKIMTGEQLYNSPEFKSWQEKENRK